MYILHEMRSAVDVKMGLRYTMAHWQRIAAGLQELKFPRRRSRQQTILEQKTEAYDKLS